LAVALLLGVSAAGCGGGQGKVDNRTSQASTAPGGSAAADSGAASGQGSGSASGQAPGQGAGSGSQPGTAANARAGSGPGGAPGQQSGGAPGSPGGGGAGRRPEAAPGAPGAPGAPADPGGQSAPGAPITIPAFTIRQGEPLERLRAEIESAIVTACGGATCLDVGVEERDGNFHPSCFVETDPRTDTAIEVERGSRFVIVAGSDPNQVPCVGDPSSDPSDPPPDDTSSSSGESEPAGGS
jgi:hypothetical protein